MLHSLVTKVAVRTSSPGVRAGKRVNGVLTGVFEHGLRVLTLRLGIPTMGLNRVSADAVFG